MSLTIIRAIMRLIRRILVRKAFLNTASPKLIANYLKQENRVTMDLQWSLQLSNLIILSVSKNKSTSKIIPIKDSKKSMSA